MPFHRAGKRRLQGRLGLSEDVSDISMACRQIAPIRLKGKMAQGDDMFRQRRSLFFKKIQNVRGRDTKRNGIHGLFGSDHRRLAEELDVVGAGHAFGAQATRPSRNARIFHAMTGERSADRR